LINLQRRVRAARARRDEHVRRQQVRGNLGGWPLTCEDRHRVDARRARLRARSLDLVGLAAGEYEARLRPHALHDGHRLEQQVESLICLERPGIEDHRRRRLESECAADV